METVLRASPSGLVPDLEAHWVTSPLCALQDTAGSHSATVCR